MATLRGLAAGAASCLLASCVTGDYDQLRTFQPPPNGSFDDLVVGITNLDHALHVLGAPVDVIEVGEGSALAWGWQETTDWNVAVSVPIGEVQGRVTYTDSSLQIPGIVLFFDRDWRLVAKREGFLGELLPERRVPRDIDDDLSADAEGVDG